MTDFDLQQQLIAQRRNQYAGQREFRAPQGQMVGRHFVAPNALQYLAEGLRSFGGMRGQELAEQELADLSKQRQAATAEALRTFNEKARGASEQRTAFEAPAFDEADAAFMGQQGMQTVTPAVAPDMPGAFAALLNAPDAGLRQMGTQGIITSAQQDAERARARQDQQAKIEALRTLGPAEAVRQGLVTSQEAEGFANAEFIGQPEVARTAEVAGPNGEKLIQSFDKRGNPMGQPVPAYMAPVQVNRGGRIEFVQPTAGQSFTVEMSPAERDAAARGWATVSQGERRLAQEGSAGARAPAGYRFTPEGNLEAIPGGPADIKAGEAGAQRAKSQEAAVAQADRVIAKVDQALSSVGPMSAGFGSLTSGIPMTPARNLQATLDTIKANLGFAELQAMREASPTGGALGAIAVQELNALQATVASLDQAQSPAQLRRSLEEIRGHYNRWKSAVQGNPPTGQGTRPPADIQDLINRYGGGQ